MLCTVIMLCMYVCICALCWWELKAMKSDKIDEHWCKLEGDLTLESSSFHPDQTIQKEPAAAVPCLQWCSVPATVGDDAPEIWLLPWAKSWQIPRRTCPVQIQVRSTWTMRCLLYVPQSSSQGGKCQIYPNISKLFEIHQRLNPCKVFICFYLLSKAPHCCSLSTTKILDESAQRFSAHLVTWLIDLHCIDAEIVLSNYDEIFTWSELTNHVLRAKCLGLCCLEWLGAHS